MSSRKLLVIAAALGTFAGACTALRASPADAGADASPDADGSDAASDADDPATPFTIVHDNPDGGALRSVWGPSADEVYVTGAGGLLLEFDADGGATGSVTLGSGFDMYSVWGASASEIYAVGTQRDTDRGIIMRTDPKGWIEYARPPHGLRAVWGIEDTRYTAGNDGVVYSGPSATPFSTGIQADRPDAAPDTLFAPIVYGIAGNNPKSVMVAADVDMNMFFDGNWHSYVDPVDPTRAYRSIFAVPGPDIDFFIGANYFGLWHFTGKQNPMYQLNEEKDVPQKLQLSIWGVWGPNSQKIVAVGDQGRIMTLDVATGVKTIVPPPAAVGTRSLYGVWGTSLDDIWICGEGELVMHGSLSF